MKRSGYGLGFPGPTKEREKGREDPAGCGMQSLPSKKDPMYVSSAEGSSPQVKLICYVGNGNIPCANCLDRAEECIVTTRRRPRTQGSQDYDSADLSRRVLQIETLLRTSVEGSRSQYDAEPILTHQRIGPTQLPSVTDPISTSLPHGDQRSSHSVLLKTTVSFAHT